MKEAKSRRSWRRRAQARPDEILDAALDEFIARGFDAARMDDVAARAGITKGALYLYFEGKEAMLRALIAREVQPIMARMEAIAASEAGDPATLIKMAAKVVSGALANPRLFALPLLVISISGRFPDLARFYRESVFARGRGVLASLIERGVALGQFRRVDPIAAARALMGPIMVEIVWTHALKGPSELAENEKLVEAQMDILLHGISAAGAP
ncbi:MAG: TetR/AcrR family transcriptional regulator [Hyphomonadaceae bacterium]